jgi:hypothetical protein
VRALAKTGGSLLVEASRPLSGPVTSSRASTCRRWLDRGGTEIGAKGCPKPRAVSLPVKIVVGFVLTKLGVVWTVLPGEPNDDTEVAWEADLERFLTE